MLNFSCRVEEACDCSFLYWHKVLSGTCTCSTQYMHLHAPIYVYTCMHVQNMQCFIPCATHVLCIYMHVHVHVHVYYVYMYIHDIISMVCVLGCAGSTLPD